MRIIKNPTGTAFAAGDWVRARPGVAPAQGLREGAEYRVVEVEVLSTFAGGFATYILQESGGSGALLRVGNGHLLLEAVPAAAEDPCASWEVTS